MQTKPSKSAKKRDHLALQDLGEQLIGLSAEQLRELSLEESLVDAIVAASGIKSHSALRRQKQLIGKLMKSVDPVPIREALDALTQDSRRAKSNFKLAEGWRDQIVTGGRSSLERFFATSGRENPALVSLVDDLGRTSNEAQRRIIRRSIFRQVHDDLTAGVQSTTA